MLTPQGTERHLLSQGSCFLFILVLFFQGVCCLRQAVSQVDKMTKWGDLESEEEESEEEEEEEEPEEDTESLADGIASIASGYNSSLPSGIETPEVIDLRKGKAGASLTSLKAAPGAACTWPLPLSRAVGEQTGRLAAISAACWCWLEPRDDPA